MTGQELATAAQYQLPVDLAESSTTACTARSACTRSATIPRRVIGTDLKNPDFAALARAYGGHGEVVERTADFPAAFRRAEAAGTFALLDLRIDPEALTPRALAAARSAKAR